MTTEEYIESLRSTDHAEHTPEWFQAQQELAQSLGLDWAHVCALIAAQQKADEHG